MRTGDEKPRVLLVDDYDDAREMYGDYLQFSGFEMIEAASGLEALERALESQPDLVVMDLSLPVMDGWETARRLKADARTAGIPILALSGHALADLSQKAKHAGFHGFITKPCLPEDLITAIREILATDRGASPPSPTSGRQR